MPAVIRADQVGSLLRPPSLLDARDQYNARQLSRSDLRKIEDGCILTALTMQHDAGLDVFGDGEFRRDSWQTPVSEAVDGFASTYPVSQFEKPDGSIIEIELHNKVVCSKLRQRRRLTKVDAEFLKQHAAGLFKITLPSPSGLARTSFQAGLTTNAYKSVQELQADFAAIVTKEMIALKEEGVAYFQLDEAFTPYVREEFHLQLETAGIDAGEQLTHDIEVENACYRAVTDDNVICAMHLCRGSRLAFLTNGGTYDWLAERLFDQLLADRFLLEYDTERIGGFEPLRFLPKDKIAVLGIVSSKDPQLETVDHLCRRIDDASQYCSVEQLALSSQCGFQGAADRDGAHMDIDQQSRKLELIAAVAEKVWK